MCNTSNLFKSILNPSKTTFNQFYLEPILNPSKTTFNQFYLEPRAEKPPPPPPKVTLLWVNFHYSLYTVNPKLGAFWGGQLNDFHSKSQSNRSNSVA